MREAHESAGGTELSWIPAWLDRRDLEEVHVHGGARPYALRRPRLAGWDQVGRGLRRAQAELADLPIADIVAAVEVAAERWCDPTWPRRVTARTRAAEATGFSSEVVDRSFDVELRNYRAASLWRTLCRELGDPAVLDGPRWSADLRGATQAVGRGVLVQLLTGNVPGLPALPIVRGLLAKSATIVKVSGAEPTFAAEFVRSLAEVDPRLGDAAVVTYWEREDLATRDAAFAIADAVVVYGGDEACAAARSATRPTQGFFEHGHKLSVGIVSSAFLGRRAPAWLARAIARDASMFNQAACIAPQAYLVEGDSEEVEGFAATVAAALDDYARACPLGELHFDEAASVQLRRAEAHYDAAGSAGHRLWAGRDWAVAVAPDLDGRGTSGHRTLRLVPVASLTHALDLLRPFGPRLQNVAAGALDDEMPDLVTALARLGASRICAPGAMPDPSLTWRHDGRMCVAELVRWCDVEMHTWIDGDVRRQRPADAHAVGDDGSCPGRSATRFSTRT